MKSFNLSLAVLFSLLFYQCCEKDKFVPLNRTVNLGSFTLLQTSINQIPYHKNDVVVFVDSLGEEMHFHINKLPPLTYDSITFQQFGVLDPLDTVNYFYSRQFLVTSIENESKTIKFRTELETKPFVSETDTGLVADLYSIRVVKIPEAILGYTVYYEYIDFRNFPPFSHISISDSVEILNKSFLHVKENLLPIITINNYPDYDIRYNDEFGIVSFVDESENLWRFDRFE